MYQFIQCYPTITYTGHRKSTTTKRSPRNQFRVFLCLKWQQIFDSIAIPVKISSDQNL